LKLKSSEETAVIRVADMKEAKEQTSVTIFKRRSSAVKKINSNCPTYLLVSKLLQTIDGGTI